MAEHDDAQPRPLPAPSAISQPFWDAAAAGHLEMQACEECDAYVWTPRARCYECGSEALTWRRMSGTGELFSFTVIRQVAGRGASAYFAGQIPYVLGLIELDEGPRMLAQVAGREIDTVEIGMRVRIRFESVVAGICLPYFEPLS